MADRVVSVKLKADISDYTASLAKAAAATRGLSGDVDKSLKDVGPRAEKSGSDSGGLFAQGFRTGFIRNSPMIAAAVGAGLAAGAPVALAGAAVLFAGIGGLAAAQTTQVRQAWTELGHGIRDDAVADAAVLVPVYEEMAAKIGAAFQGLRPEIRDAFEAAAPQIERFTDGLTGAAENALPGLVRAIQAGGPVIDGLSNLMEDVGTGLSEFFDAMSDNSGAAGQALEGIGTTLAAALPLLGELLGTGAELAADVLPALGTTLGLVADVAHVLAPILPTIAIGFASFKIAQAASGWLTSLSGSLAGVSQNLAFASYGAGNFAGTAGKLSTATSGVASSTSNMASNIGRAAGALPALGIVIAGITSDLSDASAEEDKWAQAILAGGDASVKAYEAYQGGTHWGQSIDEATGLAASWDDARQKADEMRLSMSPLQLAQLGVKQATTDLEMAAGKYAQGSPQVVAASQAVAAAQAELAWRQKEVDAATTGVTTAVRDEMTALVNVPGVATSAAGAIAFIGDTAKMSDDQVKEAAQGIVDWRNELQTVGTSFVEPLNTYRTLLEAKSEEERKAAQSVADMTVSSSDSWRDYLDTTTVTLDTLAAKLEEQIAAQQNWRTNIVTITQRGGLEVGQAIAEMGEEGVQLAAQMATGTDAEFQRMAAAIVADTRMGGAGAAAELDASMRVMAAVGAAGAGATAAGIARQLGLGVAEVARIAGQYGVTLAAGINPILGSLGKPSIHMAPGGGNIGYAEGGYTGPGGKYTPAGIVHAGEYVLTKEQTERLGVDRIEQFANNGYANGGFVTSADVPKPPSTAPYGVPISTAGDATMQKGYDDVAAWVAANAEPPAASGGSSTGLLPIMAAARQYAMDTYGIRNIGGFANRNIAGTNVKSDHAMGKAIDIMTTNLGLGWQIANDFATGPAHSKFRAENVIWQQSISSNGGRFVGMADRGSPTQNHRDHVHVDTYRTGTPHVPRDGLAYLHEGEAVVPAAINARSREFSGGGRSGGGGGATNVTVQARVFVGNREITDIARVEATTVVVDALTGSTNRGRNNS